MKNFFNISDLTKENIITILSSNDKNKNLKNKNIGLLFEKYSTRTRLSLRSEYQI